MIKLIKVISEIKLINKVTPEMVYNVFRKHEYSGDIMDVVNKWGWREYSFDPANRGIDANQKVHNFFKTLDPQQLGYLYNVIAKNPLAEIQLISKVTPEMCIRLMKAIKTLTDNEVLDVHQANVDLRAIVQKYVPSGHHSIYNLPQDQLTKFYQELTNFKRTLI